jgi:fatty acid desaturase
MRHREVSEREPRERDLWPAERQGYSDTPRAAYAAIPSSVGLAPEPRGLSTRIEARIGGLAMLVGLVWFIRAALALGSPLTLLSLIWLPSAPVGVLGIGILIWLHTQWRRAIRLR